MRIISFSDFFFLNLGFHFLYFLLYFILFTIFYQLDQFWPINSIVEWLYLSLTIIDQFLQKIFFDYIFYIIESISHRLIINRQLITDFYIVTQSFLILFSLIISNIITANNKIYLCKLLGFYVIYCIDLNLSAISTRTILYLLK